MLLLHYIRLTALKHAYTPGDQSRVRRVLLRLQQR